MTPAQQKNVQLLTYDMLSLNLPVNFTLSWSHFIPLITLKAGT
jgi:hypothetical protein